MEKYKSIIFLGFAIVIAFISSLLIYNWLNKKISMNERSLSFKTHMIAVATQNLTMGTVLTKNMIRYEPFLKKNFSTGYFLNDIDLVGRVVIAPIQISEPIMEARLAPISVKTGGISVLIPSNKRAMAIEVNKFTGASGLVSPGNRVDVLATLTDNSMGASTKTILENILVLAADGKFESTNKTGSLESVAVITLEVTPEESEKLALAVSEGVISLTLRGFMDSEDVLTEGETIPSLLSSYKKWTSQKTVIKKAQDPGQSVEIIKKNNVSSVNF